MQYHFEKYSPQTSSNYIGVSWFKPIKKWRAYITHNGKTKCLGYFTNKEDAIKARKKAESNQPITEKV